ncbi:hypothetical protein M407DRAFT_141171 [Tulasnella calospora MUT 4182]|uniref:Splicing factor Cactin n=1 Tax=Tulasnella calospora MUT 4182 TaxID=1051891 RepID=A0A0C3QQY7_9AGAM|nr:hypothetical protein M407DRAFT_141171 [Tulasnella calospora MUT 4182]
MGRERARSGSPKRRDESDRYDSRGRDYDSDRRERRDDDRRRDKDSGPSRRRSRSHDDSDRDDGKHKRRRGSRERDNDGSRPRGSEHRRRSRSRSRDREKEKEKKEKKRKKAEKQAARDDEEARQVAELSVYSALDNPFNDVNLGQQFKWHKKAEKEKKMGLTADEARKKDELRRQEAKEELERLNQRRAEREAAQILREEEEARMQRLTESAQTAEWIEKEGEFQLEQEQRRAGIRLKEKRAKAIDFLALNLKFASVEKERDPKKLTDDDGLDLDEVGMEIDFDEPYAIFENLSLEQTEELHDDIQKYLSLETRDVNIDFWTNMMVVCKDRLEKLREENRLGPEAAAAAARANVAVEREITTLLQGRSYEQLNLLQRQVQGKLSSGEPIDTEYWENLLKNIIVWKAKAKLRALHEVVVQNRLEQLRKRQRDEALQAQQELMAGVGRGGASTKNWGGDMHAEVPSEAPEETAQASMEIDDSEPYQREMSPMVFDLTRLPPEERQIEIIDEMEDRRRLFAARRTVTSSRFVPKPAKPTESGDVAAPSGADLESEALYRAQAEKDMDEDEEIFNLEEMIQNPTTYTWEDKYRPRKPRYFNRVHTGYEWNKYNQTHYDTDNPPPKVVQGYKFNIFYPDLIDKSKAPTYRIVKEPGNEDTCLLCFTAGPPYEDIAFRIVNRDWEYSHKRGFRSSFDRGCLSLWFNFRRNFYRK